MSDAAVICARCDEPADAHAICARCRDQVGRLAYESVVELALQRGSRSPPPWAMLTEHVREFWRLTALVMIRLDRDGVLRGAGGPS